MVRTERFTEFSLGTHVVEMRVKKRAIDHIEVRDRKSVKAYKCEYRVFPEVPYF